MRWSTYLAVLAPADQTRLVNALTLGWGYAVLAARLAAADRSSAVIVAHLTHAATHLATARQVLALPNARSTARQPLPFAGEDATTRPPDARTWQDILDLLGPDDAQALIHALDEVVDAAKRAAAVAQDNDEVEQAQREIDRALAALQRIHQLCTAAPIRNGMPPTGSIWEAGH